jgi:DNA-binding response OmpR family regulator
MKKIVIADTLRTLLEKEKNFANRSEVQRFFARTNEDILQIHSAEKANLIITQIDLPGMSTELLCSKIKNDEDLRSVSLIMLCPDRPAAREEAERCKPNAIMPLPCNVPELLRKAQQFLDVSSRGSYRVLVSVRVDGKSQDNTFLCSSENISTTGMLIETDRELSEGVRVECSFFLRGKQQIVVSGEVVRVIRQASRSGAHRYGIRFSQISAGAKASIDAFIARKAQMSHSEPAR